MRTARKLSNWTRVVLDASQDHVRDASSSCACARLKAGRQRIRRSTSLASSVVVVVVVFGIPSDSHLEGNDLLKEYID